MTTPRPLVSIIIRSMARETLANALASVAASVYRPLEIILVNAKGGEHPPPASLPDGLTLRLVNNAGPALYRSEAANCGLEACSGDFALFLDDDDSLDPTHIDKLAVGLQADPLALATYTGVRLVDANEQLLREVNEPWEPDRLQGMNFLPIHAVLFRLEPVRGKICFNPALHLMEDWDFWNRLSNLGPFARLPGCSATYNLGSGESGLSENRDIPAMTAAHACVLERIRQTDSLAPSRALLWFDTALTHVQGEKRQLAANLASANTYIAALEQRVRAEEATALQWRQTSEALQEAANEARREASNGARQLAATVALEATAKELQTQLDQLQLELAATKQTLTAAQTEALTKHEQLTNTQRQLAGVQEAMAATRNTLARIQGSRSWRFTAPLRALVQIIRNLMKLQK